ncbi:peptidoglycan recognition family protein [Blautia luti]|nr:peptidoglycan recognition family protein [Blautia luti]
MISKKGNSETKKTGKTTQTTVRKSARPSRTVQKTSPAKPRKKKVSVRRAGTRKSSRTSRVFQRNLRVFLAFLVFLAVAGVIAGYWMSRQQEEQIESDSGSTDGPEKWMQEGAPYIDVELLTPNEYSRPQIPISSVQYIAIHYTANPGATAMANRDYFENLASTQETKVSSHFVVGLEGEVVQCIPTSEMSYATNSRNVDTLSIECCHADETGKFNDSTYDSVVKLTAWLCTRFGLTSENVIRHYDVTGKDCPKYYVENPDAWAQMKGDIAAQIETDYALQSN